MIVALMIVGAVAAACGWFLVVRRHRSIWLVMGVVNIGLGVAALATGTIPLSDSVAPWPAAAAGLGVGLLFYGATYAFVLLIRRWPAFANDVEKLYGREGGISVPVALLLGAALTAPGEEIFWRGLFQSHLTAAQGRMAAFLLTWVAYIAVNAVGLSLPITAAAVVGGAIWGVLALWTGGVLASVVCHGVWTGLMIAFPPPGAERSVAEQPATEVVA